MHQIRRTTAVRFGLAAVLAASCVFAADEALPKAETILEKYVAATGGKSAYDKVKSEVTEGIFEIPAQGLKGKMTIYRSEPARSATVMELEGIGKIEQVTDGKFAWDNSALQGPRLAEGEELDFRVRSAAMRNITEWRKYYSKAETKSVENVGEAPCYKVEMTPNTGKVETRWYDQKSGLLLKSAMFVKTPMGEISADSFFEDYRDEGGVKIPHKMKQKTMGQEILFTVDKVTINGEIPADRFAMPPAVKALADKKQQQQQQ